MWVRHHMEKQMLEHIVLDYRTVHRRDGRTDNRQADRGGRRGKEERERMRGGKGEINRATRFSTKPYLDERKSAEKHFPQA